MEEYVERKRSLFLGLPLSFTVYTIKEDTINIKQGLIKTVEDDVYMYKIQDVKLTKTLFERIFGLGTLICYSGDVTEPKLELKHIKNSGMIKDFIRKKSEEERRKVRTLHTLDLDVDGDVDSLDTEE